MSRFQTTSKSILLGTALLLVAAWPARALDTVLQDVTVDNGDKSTTKIKRVEVTGTNLTQDELKKLFSSATAKDERKQIVAKMKASRIVIPEMLITSTEKGRDGTVTARGFQADAIDQGRAGHMVLAGFDGDIQTEEGGRARMKSGPITVDGADMTSLLAAGTDATPGMTPFSHIAWNGFELTFPDRKAADKLYRITLGSFVADGTYDGGVPLRATGKLSNLTFVPAPGTETAQTLSAAGFDKLDLGLTFSGTYNPAAKTYTIDDYTLSGVNAGALSLKGQFGAIDKPVFTGQKNEKLDALMKGSIANLELKFVNAGLFEKAATIYAKRQGKTLAQIKQEWAAMAAQVAPMMLGGDPNSARIGTALATFINDPKVLTITAKAKSGPVPFSELMAIKSPPMLLQKVDLNAVAAAK